MDDFTFIVYVYFQFQYVFFSFKNKMYTIFFLSVVGYSNQITKKHILGVF